jgi:MFS family permease
MIAGTYLGSAALVALLAVLFLSGSLTTASFMVLVCVTFFLASAGASSAYLTVSEVFPMETRALAIALFFAVGTAIGGITGPALFGQFIHSGNADLIALGFFIGAAAMALGGVAELFFGVRAEQRALEDIALPLTAEEAEEESAQERGERPPVARAPVTAEEERIRRRNADRIARDRQGLRRVRPGPGSGGAFYSPGMFGTAGTASRYAAMADRDLDREIEAIARLLEELGPTDRRRLAQLLAATGWGPRRYRAALSSAVREGRARRVSPDVYGPGRAGEQS